MEKSTAFLLALCLACTPIAQAQLAGEVNLGGASTNKSQEENQGNPQTKEITVTGLGENPQAAEKQAITDAVRQAVGSFIDANTLVQNEEVVRDRILSVSNGFVKEYKVTAPPKKRDDGLYEITIEATVETNKVVQALKENNLISGEVSGQNIWAEASTKAMNTQDAVKMLEAKIPEFIKNSVIITPLNKDLKPNLVKNQSGADELNTAPIEIQENSPDNKARLLWLIELNIDNKYYSKNIIPELIKLFNIISGSTPELISKEIQTEDVQWSTENFKVQSSRVRKGIVFSNDKFKIINPVSLNNDLCTYHQYNFDIKKILNFSSGEKYSLSFPFTSYLVIELLNADREVISSKKTAIWQPFDDTKRNQIGPFYDLREVGYHLIAPYYQAIAIDLSLNLIKEIKYINIKLEPQVIKIKLLSQN
jgi:hypothetical protein